MRSVWKTTSRVNDLEHVDLPAGARPLFCMLSPASPTSSIPRVDVWWLVDTHSDKESRAVVVAGTGHDLGDRITGKEFVGTVAIGALRFHVWA